MPQANHHDMQIYQGLVMTEENLHKEELELADENNSMIKGLERERDWNGGGKGLKGKVLKGNVPHGVQITGLKPQNSCNNHMGKKYAPGTPVRLLRALWPYSLWPMVHRQCCTLETQGTCQSYISTLFCHLQTSQFLSFAWKIYTGSIFEGQNSLSAWHCMTVFGAVEGLIYLHRENLQPLPHSAGHFSPWQNDRLKNFLEYSS